jgi:hypothetical protein
MAEPALKVDTQLCKQMRDDLGGLAAVPTQCEAPLTLFSDGQPVSAPPFCPVPLANEMGH